MKTINFLFYVDALRYDYITKTSMPFLSDLGGKGVLGRVRTSPGFTQEAAFMTGKYPEETGYFTWYQYAPNVSPFSWVRPLKLLKYLRKSRIYFPVKVGIRMLTKAIKGAVYPDPSFIPLDILPNFTNISAELPKNQQTLVSLCRNSGLACFDQTQIYGFTGSTRCSDIFETVLGTIIRGQVFDFYIIHIGELDKLGHRYGPHPELFPEYLMEIDNWIRRIYRLMRKQGFTCNIVVTSDHGMEDVLGMINVESYIRRTPFKVPKDFLYFLDSSIARFWFSNENVKSKIQSCLSSIPHGHFLSQEERTKLHLNFKNNKNGELLFWLDKGYLIFPNFFQSFGPEKTRGMHGYVDDENGALIVYSDNIEVKQETPQIAVPLVNVFDIMRCLLNV